MQSRHFSSATQVILPLTLRRGRRSLPSLLSMATNTTVGKKTATRSQSSAQSSQLQAPRAEQPALEGAESLGQTPLRLVVKDAVKRWFNETHKEAAKSDVKQQALLGQMLIEGYGCKPNPELGREWTEKARRRGYKMAGVYCEL